MRVLTMAGALAGAACNQDIRATEQPKTIRLATGSQIVASYFRELVPDLPITIVTTAGSIANLEALQHGQVDIGTAIADVTYLAYEGRLGEAPGRFDRLRGIAVLQPTAVQLVLRNDSNIASIADLRGRRVAVGAAGSETAIVTRMVLNAFGLSPHDVHGEFLPFPEAARQLMERELDAAFFSAGYPNDAVLRATAAGGRLLPVTGPPVDQLRREYPFLRNALIPEHVYARQDGVVHTIGIDNLLLCRADLDEEMVYRLAKALVEAIPYPGSRIGAFPYLDVKRAPATPLPLHFGAARYYRERELLR